MDLAAGKVYKINNVQIDTDDINEGSNQFHTTARARGAITLTDAGGDGSMTYNNSTGVITYTGPSASEVRAHVSVTDAGGDGSMAYNSTTGVITYTGPSASEVRAHVSVTDAGGDGSMAYNSTTGVITYTGPSASEVRAHLSVTDSNSIDMSYSAGAFSAAAKVDDSSIQTDATNGLQVKALGVTNAMLAGSIADGKLNQITTADKVAGSALELSATTALEDSTGMRLKTATAGDGLSMTSQVLAVNVDDSSIETDADSLRVKALGVTNAMLAGSIANAKLSNSSLSFGGVSVALGASDATPAFDLSDASSYPGDASLVTVGTITTGVWNAGAGTFAGHITPSEDSTYNLGSPGKRFANMYTGDLHLKNERGNWTIFEESDHLRVRNNLTGKMFKMGLTPIEE